MKMKIIFIICFVFSQSGYSQSKSLKKNEEIVYATALKYINGINPVYDPKLYIDPGRLSFINTFFSENDKRSNLAAFIKDNNWDFVYRKAEKWNNKKIIKLSSKKVLSVIGLSPLFAPQETNGMFSPVLMNDEMTKAFIIYSVRSTSIIFFEMKDNRWVVVKDEYWME